ncbi:MAG: BMC domain-containing protein [Tissierellia bacterium]|nr:BMC domain-containing protein [Tissierellia bacterium]
MINAIGVLESNSISRGIEVADHMLKSGTVDLLESKPACPGKYITIIYGDVGSVENSMSMGKDMVESFYVDSIIIPNVHPMVIHAVAGIPDPFEMGAIGVMEFFSIAGAIYAADAAVKAANVSIVNMRLGIAIGGKSYVTLTGDVGAITSAVEAGVEEGKQHGLLFHYNVIPSPHKQLLEKLV